MELDSVGRASRDFWIQRGGGCASESIDRCRKAGCKCIHTLGIVTSMQTTGAALDALSRISSAIPITSDTAVSTKGFMYLSGYEGSYLEEKAFEDVLGVESISTMKLLRLVAALGITIVTINQQNIGAVSNSLASEERDGVRSIPGLDPSTSTAIISNIQNLVNHGLEIQIPISGFMDCRQGSITKIG